MAILKRMKTDCTYRQGYLKDTLKAKTLKGGFIGTTDMTAFTDRLPRELQMAVIDSLYGPIIRDTWKSVVCDREFFVEDLNKNVRYSTGSPMGVYSTWSTATLALHAVVEFSAKEIGFNQFTNYLILGDDVVIFNRKV